MTDIDTSLDLAQYNHVQLAELSANGEYAEFCLNYSMYASRYCEFVHVSNAEYAHREVLEADDGAGDVIVESERRVRVRVRDDDGAYTAAFRRLHELHEELDGYPILDDDDVSERVSEAAEEDTEYYMDDAEAIVDGGEDAFDAHEMVDYLGDWAGLDLTDRKGTIAWLAWRLAYAHVDQG